MRLEMHWRQEDAASLPAALWRAGPGYRMIASGVAGGGLGEREWVLNAQVAPAYSRIDPAAHVAELAAGLGLGGAGVGLLTAASVTDVVEREDDGVRVAATVGLRVPTWAAVPPGTVDREITPIRPPGAGTVDREVSPIWRPGTINIIVSVPVPLADAAYVNAVITATEAKTQALLEAGVRATGTASDAVCIAAPAAGEPEDFAGPRSVWGARIARAVHAAVLAGARQDAAARRRVAGRVGPESVRTAGQDALPAVDRGARARPVTPPRSTENSVRQVW
jgi:adenosylcobinamide amidohydrolase